MGAREGGVAGVHIKARRRSVTLICNRFCGWLMAAALLSGLEPRAKGQSTTTTTTGTPSYPVGGGGEERGGEGENRDGYADQRRGGAVADSGIITLAP